MAHTNSARKRIRQSEKRRIANKSNKSLMRTNIKKLTTAIETKEADTKSLDTLLKVAVSTIYKTVRKGKIHRNQAARRVSRLTLKLNALKVAK